MTEYTLLCHKNKDSLINLVNQYISEGWQVQGGVACMWMDVGILLYQAMIKEIPETKTPPTKDY